MNLHSAWQVLKKDLRLGPRSPILLWAIVFPVVGTFVVQVVFGSLFAPAPRLGMVELLAVRLTTDAMTLTAEEVARASFQTERTAVMAGPANMPASSIIIETLLADASSCGPRTCSGSVAR